MNNSYPSKDELEQDVHMIGRDGEVLIGGSVVQQVLAVLPAMRPFRWMIESSAGKNASKAAYLTLKRFRDCPGCKKRKRR